MFRITITMAFCVVCMTDKPHVSGQDAALSFTQRVSEPSLVPASEPENWLLGKWYHSSQCDFEFKPGGRGILTKPEGPAPFRWELNDDELTLSGTDADGKAIQVRWRVRLTSDNRLEYRESKAETSGWNVMIRERFGWDTTVLNEQFEVVSRGYDINTDSLVLELRMKGDHYHYGLYKMLLLDASGIEFQRFFPLLGLHFTPISPPGDGEKVRLTIPLEDRTRIAQTSKVVFRK